MTPVMLTEERICEIMRDEIGEGCCATLTNLCRRLMPRALQSFGHAL
jgi:hypothetical protein